MKQLRIRLIALSCFAIGIIIAVVLTPFDHQERPDDHIGSSDAMRAFEWWYAQRALPSNLIPHGAFQRASQYVQSSMKKERERTVNSTGGSQWESIGPTNIGGRVLAIDINPSNTNIVWVGSASGGLWKSTTAGEGATPWTYVNTGFPTLSVSAIAIDSLNPNVMYIGTGEISRYQRPLVGVVGARASYGLGILKSTNGGTTWDTTGLTYTFPQITAIQKIVINPRNTSTIYAASSEGVAKSTNAGATWSIVNPELMAMDIVINPVDTTILYSSHGNLNSTSDPGIYYTDDAGVSWVQLGGGLPTSNFGRTSLTISPTNPSIIYAGVSHASSYAIIGLYKTVNGGAIWSAVSTTNFVGTQGWYDNVIAVDPTNPNNVYCAGFDIYRSTSGGGGMSNISSGFVHVDHHAITFDPSNPLIIYFGCDGGIYKSDNGGISFMDLNKGFVTTQFYPGFANAVQDSNFALGGLQDNGTLQYLGSSSWQPIFGGDGGWCAINSTNKFILYVESQYMNLAKSTNGGSGFISATSGLPFPNASNYNFIPPFVISYSNPNVLYAGSKNVYKTTNGAASWFAPNGGANFNGTNISCIGVSSTHHDTVMAATGSGALGGASLFQVFSSTNGGTNWTNVTGSLPNRYPTDIEFDPTNSTTAYLTYSGYGTPHVYKTTNIGQTWTNISSNLPDIPHQAVTVDPEEPTSIFVGTDLGVFHTSDGGGSWEEYSTGMPTAMILDLVVSRANASLRAATFGNGVYQRKLPRTPSIDVTYPNGGEILASGIPTTITWSHKYLDTVKLEYSTNNGTSWTLIADNVPASQNQYSWLVPQVATTQGRVRVSDALTGLYVDSSFGTFSILLNPDVITGWNLLSVHLTPPDARKSLLFPSASSVAYTYNGSYFQHDTLLTGVGYWLKFIVPQYTTYTGDSLAIDTIDVKAGWNMIGSISTPVATSTITEIPSGIVTSSYFGYVTGYTESTVLEPKKGYWVKTNADGKLILQSSSMIPQSVMKYYDERSKFNSLTITDRTGQQQTLYYTDKNITVDKYELPPVPPQGVFDVRFGSNQMVEEFNPSKEISILVSSASYPLTVSWQSISKNSPASLISNEGIVVLVGRGESRFASSESQLRMRFSSETPAGTPCIFTLNQNYPNPFNPTTSLRYQLPSSGHVTLKVVDILGREVTLLVNEEKQAGSYQIEWDASSLASGMYFARLEVRPEYASKVSVDMKKMLLLK